jgi:hypothetical protein
MWSERGINNNKINNNILKECGNSQMFGNGSNK